MEYFVVTSMLSKPCLCRSIQIATAILSVSPVIMNVSASANSVHESHSSAGTEYIEASMSQHESVMSL